MACTVSHQPTGDLFDQFIDQVYARALESGRVVDIGNGESRFAYASVASKNYSPRSRSDALKSFIQTYERQGAIGIHNNDKCIVFEKNVPPLFRDLMGLHQWIEAHYGVTHAQACLLDLTVAQSLGHSFQTKHARWFVGLGRKGLEMEGIVGVTKSFFGSALPLAAANFVMCLRDNSQIAERYKSELIGMLARSGENPRWWINRAPIISWSQALKTRINELRLDKPALDHSAIGGVQKLEEIIKRLRMDMNLD